LGKTNKNSSVIPNTQTGFVIFKERGRANFKTIEKLYAQSGAQDSSPKRAWKLTLSSLEATCGIERLELVQ
jgi:hypothetical protein